jgi:hypothetical protein
MGLFSSLFDRHPNMNKRQLRNFFDMMDDPYWQLSDACERWSECAGKGCYASPHRTDGGELEVHMTLFHEHGNVAHEIVAIGAEFDLRTVHRKLHDAWKRLRVKVSPFPPELVQIPGRNTHGVSL